MQLGWFTNGYLLQTHPTKPLFLVEISETRNSSSLVPLTPIPGAFVWFSLGWASLAIEIRPPPAPC